MYGTLLNHGGRQFPSAEILSWRLCDIPLTLNLRVGVMRPSARFADLHWVASVRQPGRRIDVIELGRHDQRGHGGPDRCRVRNLGG